MSDSLKCPPVPELARAKGSNVAELTDWFFEYYEQGSRFFNYRASTLAVRAAYRGVHDIKILRSAIGREHTKQGRVSNDQVICLAAPISFGRSTQVFDLAPRRFAFGRERYSSFRIPFMFVEGGVVKAYFLQPRKGAGLNIDEFGMVAAIIKNHLLDQEFYGQQTDLEVVDVSAPLGAKDRVSRQFSLNDLPIWEKGKLADRLTLISEALDVVQRSGLIKPRHERRPVVDPSMPLFD